MNSFYASKDRKIISRNGYIVSCYQNPCAERCDFLRNELIYIYAEEFKKDTSLEWYHIIKTSGCLSIVSYWGGELQKPYVVGLCNSCIITKNPNAWLGKTEYRAYYVKKYNDGCSNIENIGVYAPGYILYGHESECMSINKFSQEDTDVDLGE